ncbi:MAG: TlyA family RNA methyltransferase [Candidatus Hydrogenedentota bacterium]|nr:MAG: TlyA family RNA methyltransferase [Candidatus Hydrogenedentota bacterium]
MRLDEFLVFHRLAENLAEAQALILKGDVFIENTTITKAGYSVPADFSLDKIRIRKQKKYVARSAEKLLSALNAFSFSVQNKIALDCGSSTGGFCEVLLEKGVKKLYAVDVGYGLLHPKIRKDDRVVVLERQHFLKLKKNQIKDRIDFCTFDVSFISLRKILLHAKSLFPQAEMIAMLKPQFEVPANAISKFLEKGIVKEESLRQKILTDFEEFLKNQNIKVIAKADSTLKGTKGNLETFYYLRFCL